MIKSLNDGKQNRAADSSLEVKKFKETVVKDVSATRHSINGALNKVLHQIQARKDVQEEQKKLLSEETHQTKSKMSEIEKVAIKESRSATDFDKLLEIHDIFRDDIKSTSSRYAKLVSKIDEVLGNVIMQETLNTLNLSGYQLESLLYRLEDFELIKHDFEKNLSKERDLDAYLEIKK